MDPVDDVGELVIVSGPEIDTRQTGDGCTKPSQVRLVEDYS
jgi:hypothetical protein